MHREVFKRITGLAITHPPSSFHEKFKTINESSLMKKYFGSEDSKTNLKVSELRKLMDRGDIGAQFEKEDKDLDVVMLAEKGKGVVDQFTLTESDDESEDEITSLEDLVKKTCHVKLDKILDNQELEKQ
ncbi:hypothetical protein RND71_014829 [Anisodus tanguticus]|uniref:Uncharacterized protein n=1 Tax=Anisodus tanguticus TaxID=243964 RepID=A0AAE1SCC9_9SOLA|nr:hypothetical protein RND71_014829 [Anisodus tanguticus]